MSYNPQDFYFKKAKQRHFAARSVFKLEEIDKRFKLLKEGDKVLDLGCAPGSWSQYASFKIGNKGHVIGIDLQKVSLSLPHTIFIQGNAFDHSLIEKVKYEAGIDLFDIVMSDMAPKTTGIRMTDQQRSLELCRNALEIAKLNLKKGGYFIVKFFQSGEFEEYLSLLKTFFQKVETIRPQSTRKASYEIYLVGIGKF